MVSDISGPHRCQPSAVTFMRSLSRLLALYRWYLLGIAGVVAFVLGCIGFWRLPGGRDLTSVVYGSLKLFLFNSPDISNMPVQLDIARFLAPVVAGWAGLTALGTLFRDRVQQMRIPLMRGHVVICGLGYIGSVFLRQLHDAGMRAVVIDSDPANPHIDLCRSWGVPVITGDAQLARTLYEAGVGRADLLVAVCPDDPINTEIVAVARKLSTGRARGELQCLARISNPDLCALLRIQEAKRGDEISSLDFFNTEEISARVMLDHYPVDTAGKRPHILVAHLDVLGVWVILRAARGWYDNRTDDTVPLTVTVVDDDAEHRIAALGRHHPELKRVCRFISCSTPAGDIRDLPTSHAKASVPPLNCAYVTAYRDEQALETALKLRYELDVRVPVVVALSRAHGMARLISDGQSASALSNIDVFPTLRRTCTVELIRGGSYEPLAREIHNRWYTEQLADGNEAKPWDEADESLKESSRAHARHIAVKLRSIGYEIAPLRDWDASEFMFTPNEVEKLAALEHDRWVKERIGAGWKPGDKNVELKQTPYLVPFAELDKRIADYDRMLVRAIPAMLASVGLQVIRTRQIEALDRSPPSRQVGEAEHRS
jgi:voltage-gated potassium channel Kch